MDTRDYYGVRKGKLVRGGRAFCFHLYSVDQVHGSWRYRKCRRCERRVVDRVAWSLGSPIDWGFLGTGEFTQPPVRPPRRSTRK